MKTFSIKEAIKTGWALFKKDKKNLILIALAFSILGNGGNFESLPAALEIIVGIIAFCISILFQIGWTKTLLKVVDGGRAKFSDLFEYSRLFFKYLGTLALLILRAGWPVMLASLIGFAFLALPPSDLYLALAIGIGVIGAAITTYLSVKYQFSLILVIDKEIGITKAFRESARMTEGIRGKLFKLLLVIGLLYILGLLALIVGVLVALPVATLAHLWVYRRLSQ